MLLSLLIASSSLLVESAKPDPAVHPALRQALALLRRSKSGDMPDPLEGQEDNNPAYEETGMSSIVLGILIAGCVVVGIVLIAYIVYRYRQWKPRTKPATVRRASVSDTPETQKLVNAGIAVPVTPTAPSSQRTR